MATRENPEDDEGDLDVPGCCAACAQTLPDDDPA
jgi:hypothetical protein